MPIEPKSTTQAGRLLAFLRTGKPIDPLTAWRALGIYRLGARVFDLRRAGFTITDDRLVIRNRFNEVVRVATYKLNEEGK